MAAPVYVSSQSFTSNFSNTVSGSFDAGQSENRCVVALLWSAQSAVSECLDLTFAGNTMSDLGGINNLGSPYYAFHTYALVGDSNIPTGAQTITGRFSGTTLSIHGNLFVHAFSGVDPQSISAIVASAVQQHTQSQSPSWTIANSATDDLAVAVFFRENTGHTLSAGSGVTKAYDSVTGGWADQFPSCCLTKAGATNVVVNGTISSTGDNWGGMGFTLTPGSSGARTGSFSKNLDACADVAAGGILIVGALS